jgi:hypothetical protein
MKFDIVLRAGHWWERAWIWFRARVLCRPIRIGSAEILSPNFGLRLMDFDEEYLTGE